MPDLLAARRESLSSPIDKPVDIRASPRQTRSVARYGAQ